MKYFLRTLGFLWLLPATILVWTFYISWAWLFGLIIWKGWHSYLIAQFQLKNVDSWYAKLWKDWYGWSGPCVLIYKDKPGEWDDAWVARTKVHEADGHCVQQFVFGIFHYPLYLLESVYLWLFKKDKHAYLDNRFERHARGVAGQQVDFTQADWPHGKGDRWPWW